MNDPNYFVILLGSPGIGKSIARKIGLTQIYPNRRIDEYDILYDTFVDIDVDKMVYTYVYASINTPINKSGLQLIKEATSLYDLNIEFDDVYKNDVCSGKLIKSDNKEKLVQLEKLYEISYKQYFDIRNKLDSICDELLEDSIRMSKNIFIETTGIDSDYLITIIEKIKSSYQIVIMYPIMTNDYEHARRIFNRGKVEGRYPNIDDTIRDKPKVEETVRLLKMKYEDINIYKYESIELSMEEIENYRFNGIKYI